MHLGGRKSEARKQDLERFVGQANAISKREHPKHAVLSEV